MKPFQNNKLKLSDELVRLDASLSVIKSCFEFLDGSIIYEDEFTSEMCSSMLCNFQRAVRWAPNKILDQSCQIRD